jgi:uncharacterized membrane protein
MSNTVEAVEPEAELRAEEEAIEGASTDRLLTLSDGVFAIVITLLALEVKVPHPAGPTDETTLAVLRTLARQWPMYLAYLLGFVTVGIMWSNHVTLFRYILRTDHKLVALNTLLLLSITLVPFATALLAEYLPLGPGQRQAGTLLYSGLMVLMAVTFNVLWGYANRPPRALLDETLDPHLFDEVTKRYRFGPALYLAAFACAFLSVSLSMTIIAGLAALFAIPYGRDPHALPARRSLPFLRGRTNGRG